MVKSRTKHHDKPLGFHWEPLSPEWLDVLDLPPADNVRMEQARSAILLDAILEAFADDRWISYSRRRGFYSGMSRYQGTAYTYRTVVPTVNALVEAGLLDHDRMAPGSLGFQSRIRASQKLRSLVMATPEVRYDPIETIRLKRDGHLTDYRDTKRTQQQRRNLGEINEAITSSKIELPGVARDGNLIHIGKQTINTSKQSLHRVFNDSWALGGRYYGGWWQQLKGKHRRTITIDGVTVVEHDHKHLHPRLLYQKAGKVLLEDAYELPGDRLQGTLTLAGFHLCSQKLTT